MTVSDLKEIILLSDPVTLRYENPDLPSFYRGKYGMIPLLRAQDNVKRLEAFHNEIIITVEDIV